ncbi:MAG: hypothetical protein ACXWR0_05025 [Bdellovibrio sp.]
MRFPLAWAETAKQNSILKYSLLLSSIMTIIFSITTVTLSMKKPLVIERACFSSLATLAKQDHTDREIEEFTKIAIDKRFSTDSNADILSWLSNTEFLSKQNEAKELKAKNITQKILVSKVNIQGNQIVVEFDRVLSVEKLRTVIPATILAQISSTDRNEINQYGLILEKVELKKEVKDASQAK